MELYIDLNVIAREDPLDLGKRKDDSPYLRCARYQSTLTEKIKALFEADGYRQVSTTSSLTKVMFLFSKGGHYLKLKNSLEPNDPEKRPTASVSIEGNKEMIVKVEALLKSLGIPKKAASILN